MSLSSQTILQIEAKAQDALESVYNHDPIDLPINLQKILNQYGLHLKAAEFDQPDAWGLFDRSKQTIYVAKDATLPRAAFTIAHELGHFILHQDKQKETFWRMDGINMDVQDKTEEQEANWFAASLLMPKSLVLKYWQHSRSVENVAAIFGVSNTALVWRLKNLGVVE